MTKFSIISLTENIFQFVFNLDAFKWLHTLKPNRIRAKKSCFSDWSTAGNLLSQESKKKKSCHTGKTDILQTEKARDSQFCPVALQVSISHHGYNYEVIFPHFSLIKRCSIICANFNISPLEIINCFHNTELFKWWGGKKNPTKKPFLKRGDGGEGTIIYELRTWESLALWKEWFLWNLMKWSVQLHC